MSRYLKHEILKAVGKEGQKRLALSRVVIIGGGALGSGAADTLVRAGTGHVTIIDPDRVELGNLHRTALFDESDIGRHKAEVLEEKLGRINSDVKVRGIVDRVDRKNIEEFIEDADIVVDGTDNLRSRFIINDACVKKKIPWVYSGVLGTAGNIMIIEPEGACLRCLFPKTPEEGSYPTCDQIGIFGVVPEIMGRLGASEAMRYLISEEKNPGRGYLRLFETWPPEIETVEIEKRKDCPACSLRHFEFLEEE